MQEPMTLKRIATLTGYSVSTVSKALNDKWDISPSTKKKILQTAKNHNYTPNHLAVSLRRQKTGTIAVMVPDLSKQQYACVVSEMQKLTFSKGLKLLVFQHFEDQNMENKSMALLNNGIVDGVIIIVSKRYKNYSSYPISMPYVVMELKKIDDLNINCEQVVGEYFSKLLRKIC